MKEEIAGALYECEHCGEVLLLTYLEGMPKDRMICYKCEKVAIYKCAEKCECNKKDY